MLHLKMPRDELDLPIYSLSEKKSREKSCFIDSNRIDTVKPAKSERVPEEKKEQKDE